SGPDRRRERGRESGADRGTRPGIPTFVACGGRARKIAGVGRPCARSGPPFAGPLVAQPPREGGAHGTVVAVFGFSTVGPVARFRGLVVSFGLPRAGGRDPGAGAGGAASPTTPNTDSSESSFRGGEHG